MKRKKPTNKTQAPTKQEAEAIAEFMAQANTNPIDPFRATDEQIKQASETYDKFHKWKDRKYFIDNPGATEYDRPAFPGEIAGRPSDGWRAVVRQIRPGVRARRWYRHNIEFIPASEIANAPNN